MNYYVRVCCILWSCKSRLPKIIKTFHIVLILPNPETGPEYTKAYLTHFPTLLTTRYAWKTLTEVWICWLDLRSCVPTRAQLVTRKINIRVTLWVTLTSKAGPLSLPFNLHSKLAQFSTAFYTSHILYLETSFVTQIKLSTINGFWRSETLGRVAKPVCVTGPNRP